jgi:putative DNA primase/helicase
LRGRHIPCPLHQENTPSFKVYEEDSDSGNFYCYGCQKSGDIISFVVYKEGCSAGQALAKLSKTFHINLITRENTPDTLVSSLELILGKKKHESPKEVTELVHWQVVAEKASREFDTLESEMVPYLIKKKLHHIGTKSKYDILIIPMMDINDKLWAFQQIQADGTKMFLENAKKKDLMMRLGEPNSTFAFICEGWATGASVFISTGITTYVAFSASNLDSVSEQVKNKYPGIRVVVAGDNDESGRMHHQSAVYPSQYKTDWSDVFVNEGSEKVKNLLIHPRFRV